MCDVKRVVSARGKGRTRIRRNGFAGPNYIVCAYDFCPSCKRSGKFTLPFSPVSNIRRLTCETRKTLYFQSSYDCMSERRLKSDSSRVESNGWASPLDFHVTVSAVSLKTSGGKTCSLRFGHYPVLFSY